MVIKYFDGAIPSAPLDEAITSIEKRVTDAANAHIDAYAINEALSDIWELVDALNGYITETEPWALAKDPAERARLESVLATAVHGLGTLAVLLAPVLPKATARLWAAIGGSGAVESQRIDTAWSFDSGSRVTALEVSLFPRIEIDEVESA